MIFQYQVMLDLDGFKYTPLDFTFLWSLTTFDQYCYAVQWSTLTATAIVNTVLNALECNFGALGLISDQFVQCQWRRY